MMYLGQDPVGLATSIPTFADKADIEYGEYIPTEDTNWQDVTISHSLGAIPDFVIYFPVNLELSYNNNYVVCGDFIPAYKIDNDEYVAIIIRYLYASTNSLKISNGAFKKSDILTSFGITDSSIKFFSTTASKLKANTIYHYIIGKYKEVTSNANE